MLLLEGSCGLVHSLSFSPDGTLLASAAGRSRRVNVWNLTTNKTSWFQLERRIQALAFVPFDPPMLAWSVSGPLGQIVVGNHGGGYAHPVDRIRYYSSVPLRLVFSPDGKTLAANGIGESTRDEPFRHEYGVTLWDWQRGEGFGRALGTDYRPVFNVAFSPDGQTLAIGGIDRRFQLRDVNSQRPARVFCHDRKVHFLTFCCDGEIVVSGSSDGLVHLWDVETCKKRRNLHGVGKTLLGLMSSPDGRMLATTTSDGRVRMWDAETGRPLAAYDWGIGPLSCLAFAPDGLRAAAGGLNTVVVWDIDL